MMRITVRGTEAQKNTARQTLTEFAAPDSFAGDEVLTCLVPKKSLEAIVTILIARLRERENAGRGCRITTESHEEKAAS